MANYLVDPKTGTVGEATKAAMNVGDKVYSGGGVYVKQADGSFAKEAGSKSTSNWNDVVSSYNAANGGGGGSRGSSYNDDDGFTHTQVSGGGRSGAETTGTLATGDYYRNYALTNNDNIDWYNSIAKNGNVSSNGDGTYTVYDGNQNYMGRVNADGTFTSSSGTTDPTTNAIHDSWGRAAVDLLRSYDAIGKGIINPATGQNISYDANAYREAAKAGQDPMAAVSGGAYVSAQQQLVQQLLEQQRQAEQQLAQQQTQEGKGLAGFEQYLQEMGYTDYKDQVSAAIAAQVQEAVDAYNQQITKANQGYEDAARQAYVAKMLSQKNLDQMLSANGYAGGMADSQRIATETSYQNNLYDLTKQKEDTIKEIEAAITAARLSGDQQLAQLLASYLQNVQGDYSNYVNQQNSLAQQQEQTQRNSYAQLAMNALQLGQMPSADLLALAGIDAETAQSIINGVSGQGQSPTLSASQAYTAYNKGIQTPEVMEAMSYYYGVNAPQATQQTTQKTGGTSYNNGGLSMADVKKVQAYYGLAQDGYWGPNSQSKTGFSSAAQAQAAMGNTSTGASFSDIKRTMQQLAATGNENKIVSIANQYAGSMTGAQKQELQTMMRQYGYEISF